MYLEHKLEEDLKMTGKKTVINKKKDGFHKNKIKEMIRGDKKCKIGNYVYREKTKKKGYLRSSVYWVNKDTNEHKKIVFS